MLVPRAAGSFRYTVSAAFKNAIVVNTKYFMNDGPVARPISHPVQGNGHIFRLHLIYFFYLLVGHMEIPNMKNDSISVNCNSYKLFKD